MDKKNPKIITIASIKGGVGKSTTSLMFTNILSKKNNKILLIDLDPQASSTSFYINILRKKTLVQKILIYIKFLKKK
nr:ParA family protein [Borreliella burgdorferi]